MMPQKMKVLRVLALLSLSLCVATVPTSPDDVDDEFLDELLSDEGLSAEDVELEMMGPAAVSAVGKGAWSLLFFFIHDIFPLKSCSFWLWRFRRENCCSQWTPPRD